MSTSPATPSFPSPLPVLAGTGTPEFLALQRAVAGRYSLERELGRGGMGIVFLARDVALDRPVAIKLLPPELAARSDLRQGFLREARTAAGLAHPHIVPIHAVEEHDDLVFFVMGFVDGETLGARLRRVGPLAPGEAMRVTQEVAWALAHAHSRGIVHRDVKPDNILLERDTGRAIVTDFGIARATQSVATESKLSAGTPHYMSPEQARGENVDGRSDLYSLGVTTYRMVTGRLPQTPERAYPAALPSSFVDLLDHMLAESRSERTPSAESLAAAIGVVRGSMGSVPAPVRHYLETSQQAASEIGTLLAASVAAMGGMEAIKLIQGDFLGFVTVMQVVPTLAFAGLTAVRAWQLIDDTRKLIAQGYRHDAVRVATVTAAREQSLAAVPTERPATRKRMFWQIAGGGALTSLGFLMLAGGGAIAPGLEALGWVLGVSAPVITMHTLLRSLRTQSHGTLWQRLLQGRVGRVLFSVAQHTVRHTPAAASAEPTVVLLARATEDLYHALPGDLRQYFSDLPSLVARLHADAAASQALAPDDPNRARRLSAAVTALENIRLDLLRFHTGRASLDELTADLERVRDVERQVDAMLEVRTPTRTPTPTPA